MSSSEFSALDRAMMDEALALAARGRNTTTPNPCVGCVVVQHGDIVGRGWHQRAGEPHAEVLALREAGERSRGATVYVTLEPCNVKGRTGPCTEALLAAGVARVVAAVQDPNPAVSGRALDQLRAAGVAVDCGLKAADATELNRGFFSRMQRGQPFVHAKMASSIDGRTAMSSGESQWITGPAARREVQKFRAQSCALVTGVDTVCMDDPRLTVRSDELGEAVQRMPDLVIVDTNLRTPPGARLFGEQGRRVIIACAQGADPALAEALSSRGAEIVHCDTQVAADGKPRIELAALLAMLAAREYNEVMLESGASLFGAFLSAGLIDELSLFIAPRIFGQTARPLAALDIAEIRDAKGLSIVEARPVAGDFLLRLKPAAAKG